jgi:hypothetical protein
MSDLDDYFRVKAVTTMRDHLIPERQVRFDKWAADKTLKVQLEWLVKDAMEYYQEPECLKERKEVKPIFDKPFPPRRKVVDNKKLASGDDS